MIGLYAGSFDPITFGHLDIIKRASKLCDTLYVLCAFNTNKNYTFELYERVRMLKEELCNFENVEVKFTTLTTVDYAVKHNVDVLFRGIRTAEDFNNEAELVTLQNLMQMVDNSKPIETLFLKCSDELRYVSSSNLKEFINLGKYDTANYFAPKNVIDKLRDKI